MTRIVHFAACCSFAVATLAPAALRAQSCGTAKTAELTARRWDPPLDRVISLHERGVALRDALDRLAAAARVRLAYSAELIPLDRRVCARYRSVPAGAALTQLLEGAAVEPVVTDSDRVVLAPSREPQAATSGLVSLKRASVLERVVVTGTVNGSAQRAVPVALDVVDGRELDRRDARSLSSILNGSVPGVWMWEQSPTSLLARYASIRGASSFGISYPKVYVDGIEVANSLLVTELDVESVERVEVIRGPQGAALYGADAISGVINIITRHDGTDGGAPRAQLQTGAGVAGSVFAPSNVLTQRHSVSFRGGSGVRSGSVGLTASTLGDYIPDAYDRRYTLNTSARRVDAHSILSATARFLAEDAAAPTSPLLSSIRPVPARPDTGAWQAPFGDSTYRQSVRQYTVGATATLRGSERWTHSAVIGLDGYRLRDASSPGTPFTSAADSALRAARGAAARGTVRISTIAQLGATERATGNLTMAFEHSAVREASRVMTTFGPGSPGDPYATQRTVQWRSNTGLITQLNGAWHDKLFLTGGIRIEHNGGVVDADKLSALPMLGATFVRDFGSAALKLRGAYGKGIRPPETTSRATSWMGFRGSSTANLSAEEQSGIEGGFDLVFARTIGIHVTRFDQLVSGLIQPVAVSSAPTPPPGGGGGGGGPNDGRRIAYELQNVGEITNRGWEIAGSAGAGGLTVSTALSFVDSRVKRTAREYSGDLRPGDRMLEVPDHTVSLTTSYVRGPWSLSVTGSRAYDWVNYDRVALATEFMSRTRPGRDPVGGQLRSFWREYSGVNRLRASASFDLRRTLSLVASGDNLLDHQLGEPDNVTVLPGRTVTLGIRAKF